MLVLRRRVGEQVWIGETCVTILAIAPHQVKLGFTAPPDIVIVRSELMKQEQPFLSPTPSLPPSDKQT